jgi:hypothetical protein
VRVADCSEVFDFTSREWSAAPVSWTEAHQSLHGEDCAVVAEAGCVYVLGGVGQQLFGADVHASCINLRPMLRPSASAAAMCSVQRLPSMQMRRDRCVSAVAQGCVFVFGGVGEDGAPTDCVEALDLSTQRWTLRRALPLAAEQLIAIASADQRFIVLCARCATASTASSSSSSSAAAKYELPASSLPGTSTSTYHAWRYDVTANKYDLLAPVSFEEAAAGCWWKGAAVIASICSSGPTSTAALNTTIPSVQLLPAAGREASTSQAAWSLRQTLWQPLPPALRTCDVRRRLCLATPSDRSLYLFAEAREPNDTQLQVFDELTQSWNAIPTPPHFPIQSYLCAFVHC